MLSCPFHPRSCSIEIDLQCQEPFWLRRPRHLRLHPRPLQMDWRPPILHIRGQMGLTVAPNVFRTEIFCAFRDHLQVYFPQAVASLNDFEVVGQNFIASEDILKIQKASAMTCPNKRDEGNGRGSYSPCKLLNMLTL
jgi:hypothetical protein